MIRQKYRLKIGNITIPPYIEIAFLCMFITILNSLSVKNTFTGFFIGLVETLILLYILVFKSIYTFTVIAIILLSLNIENGGFALGSRSVLWYSIYNLPVLRGYLLLLIMCGALFKVFFVGRFKISRPYDIANKLYLINMLCIVSALMMTGITLFLNDNDLRIHKDMWRYIARDIYQIIYVFSIFTLSRYCLKYDATFKYTIKKVLLGILAGVTWASLILILLKNYYIVWGGEAYLTCPLILFFAPALLLFSFEENGWLNFITGCIALVVQLKFTVGIAGTWWVFVFIIALCFFRQSLSLKDEKIKYLIKIIIGFCIIGGCFILFEIGFSPEVKGQISYKLSTVLRLFRVNTSWNEWYMALGGSIQARLEEMLNAIIELFQNPWALLFGKGYGGTVLKHWGISNWDLSGSTFPDIQIVYKTYSSFHIALAEIFINFGFVGMIMCFMVIKNCIEEFFKKNGNMWIILGTMWFVFFYSLYYSFNVGLVWLYYGFYLKSEAKKKLQKE